MRILHLLIHTQFAFAVQPMVDFHPPVPCGMNLFQAPVTGHPRAGTEEERGASVHRFSPVMLGVYQALTDE